MNIASFVRFGWETFWKRPGLYIKAELILAGVYILGTIVTSLLNPLFALIPYPFIAALVGNAIGYAVGLGIGVSSYAFFLRAVDHPDTVRVSDLKNFKHFWKFVAVTILYAVGIFIGFLLLIVPGIILSLTWYLAPILVIDKGLGPLEALHESARLTKGRLIKLFVLTLAMSLIYFGGIIALFVGVLVAYPVANLAFMRGYRRMSRLADENAAPENLSRGEKGMFWAAVGIYILFVGLIFILATAIGGMQSGQRQNFYPDEPGFVIHREDPPASSLAPLRATRLPFTSFSLTNNTAAEVVVQSITVDVSDLPNPRGIAGIEVVEYSGLQTGDTVVPKSDGTAEIVGPFVIPVGITRAYIVAANIAGCDLACPNKEKEVHIDLTGLTTAAQPVGELPITGATHVMNPVLVIGAASLTKDIAPMLVISTGEYSELFNMTVLNNGSEQLKLFLIRFKYEGTVRFDEIRKPALVINGREYPAEWSEDGRYLSGVIDGGADIGIGDTMSISLKGTVGPDHDPRSTIRFDIDKPSHVYFVGQTYGYGITPSLSDGSVGAPWIRGDTITVQ